MSLASSLSSVGSVEGCGACDEPATLPASKRRKLEDSQHEPLSPAAPDAYGRDEEGQDSVTAQVGRPYNRQRGLPGLGCRGSEASFKHSSVVLLVALLRATLMHSKVISSSAQAFKLH